jgi:hypothetical protein
MEIAVDMEDIKDVERVINSEAFAEFLLSKTTSICAAIFIAQAVRDAVEQAKEQLDS